MQNGFFHLYQLYKSIFNLSAVGWYLSFFEKKKKIWQSSLKAISRDPDQMSHSTVSDLGLYCLSRQDVSGKYYFFIAKVTVSFFSVWCEKALVACRELFHAFLSSADVFILLYFLLFFWKNIFFSRRNQNKKIKQLQSSPAQILFVQPDLGPNCMLML